MNILKRIKHRLAKATQNNLSLAIYSVLIACFCWFVISMTLYPSVTKNIENVTISVDISGSSAAENGLSVISCDVKEVNIKVKGSRTQAANINSESFTAYIDADNISTAGRKTLPIKIKSNTGMQYEVESISPPTASVVLDKYDTIEMPVSPRIPNVVSVDGKTIYRDELICEPNVITITGPSAQLAKIANCYAVSNKKLTLDSSYTLQSDELQLCSEDGTIIDQTQISVNNSTFTISIPVLTQKTVDLTVQIVNAPAEFDKSSLKFIMSVDSLTIASRSSTSEIPDSLEIGKIVLSDLDIGFSKTFEIKGVLEDSNMLNMSGVETVTVTLDDSNLEKKELVLDQSNIHISNVPNSNEYDYNLLTKSLRINVVGPKEIISDITSANFIADANLLNAENLSEQFSYDATFSCPTSDKVWSVTKASVKIQKTKHIEPETTSADEDVPVVATSDGSLRSAKTE
jgi:hypothetical protein rflaF_12449